MKEKQNRPTKAYAQYFGIAFQMIAIIGVGTFLGIQLDRYYETEGNGFTAGLSLLSVLIALFYVIRQILDISKKDKK